MERFRIIVFHNKCVIATQNDSSGFGRVSYGEGIHNRLQCYGVSSYLLDIRAG